MGRWTELLPEPQGDHPRTWLRHALTKLAWALDSEGLFGNDEVLGDVRQAAAEVRAWRKSLPEQGERVPSSGIVGVVTRDYLRGAARGVLYADQFTDLSDARSLAYNLREAEAYLRVVGLRLMDRIEASDE